MWLKSIVLAASVAAATAFAPMAGVLPKSSREYPPKNPPVACSRNELEGMKGRARSVGSKGWLARRFMGFFAAGMETETQEHVTAPSFLLVDSEVDLDKVGGGAMVKPKKLGIVL